jgi:hypothetical protein
MAFDTANVRTCKISLIGSFLYFDPNAPWDQLPIAPYFSNLVAILWAVFYTPIGGAYPPKNLLAPK